MRMHTYKHQLLKIMTKKMTLKTLNHKHVTLEFEIISFKSAKNITIIGMIYLARILKFPFVDLDVIL